MTLTHRLTIVVTLGVLLVPRHGFAQRSLDDVRGDVRRPASPSSEPAAPRSTTNQTYASMSEPNDDFGLSELFGALVLLPFSIGAHELAEAQPFPLLFLDYPYQGNFLGFMSRDLETSEQLRNDWAGRIGQREWFGRLTLDEGYDFTNRVNRASGSLLLDSTTRFGFQTAWSVLSERNCRGGTDSLALGNMNVTFRYLETRRIILRAGLGANTLVDRYGNDWGFNFHLDSDWFLKRPFVVSTVFDAGTLGSTGLVHARGTVGAIWNRWEAFGGYDWLQIGSTNIHGPVVGVRLWF